MNELEGLGQLAFWLAGITTYLANVALASTILARIDRESYHREKPEDRRRGAWILLALGLVWWVSLPCIAAMTLTVTWVDHLEKVATPPEVLEKQKLKAAKKRRKKALQEQQKRVRQAEAEADAAERALAELEAPPLDLT